ncbi:uncharacterized protein LOC134854786 [Symsagittifera roscoffensis]|uniref:uncharacterized protein LOC134854786 n=1 Tax=Symsagittifera roscoffensis TaxID=84072 RepID=UPI00307B7522
MYREELEWMIHTPEKLVVGGDLNSSVGDLSGRERNEAAGPCGFGHTNDAGNDLMNWCLRNNLQWANSFFRHRYRGTWKHTVTGARHEIDGFLVEKKVDRQRWVKDIKSSQVRTDASDHLPKEITCNLFFKLRIVINPSTSCINWDRLKEDKTSVSFQKKNKTEPKTGAGMGKAIQVVTKAGKKCCGLKEKKNLPWMDDHKDEIQQYQEQITRETEEIDNTRVDEQTRRRQNRKGTRKRFKADKERWEEEWWLKVVEEAKAAERTGDIRKLYSALKRIRIKDSTTIEEKYFTPNEFREHFQKVSDQRFEREIHEIKETSKLATQRWDENSIQAAKVLGREITWPEFNNEIESINDSAPGIENVRMIAVKRGGKHLRQALFRCIMKIVETQSEDWPERIKEGWVIPLHKKSAKNDLNN